MMENINMGAGAKLIECPVCDVSLALHIKDNKWLFCMRSLMNKLDGSLSDRLDKRIDEVKDVVTLTQDCLINKDFDLKEQAKAANYFWGGVLKELEKLKSDTDGRNKIL